MTARMLLIAGIALLMLPSIASAADHSLTAIAAGGLTEQSQPFQNGLNNPGRNSEDVPGQGSQLSGEDQHTPPTAGLFGLGWRRARPAMFARFLHGLLFFDTDCCCELAVNSQQRVPRVEAAVAGLLLQSCVLFLLRHKMRDLLRARFRVQQGHLDKRMARATIIRRRKV